jgi:hypothetical protein
MGSWIPITPEKPIPARSHPIVVNRRGNWQELARFSDGYAKEIPNCNGFGAEFESNWTSGSKWRLLWLQWRRLP